MRLYQPAPVPKAASSSMREGDWNAVQGLKTSLVNEMTGLRTYRSAAVYEKYVVMVHDLWCQFSRAPNSLAVKDLCFEWKIDRDRTLRVHSISHELLITCFVWVQEDLLQEGDKKRAKFIQDLIKAARVVRWIMLPVCKLLHMTDGPIFMQETGCRQLLSLCLIELMYQCILRAESRNLTDKNFLGMTEWVLQQSKQLTKLGKVDLTHMVHQMRALQLLYVTPDNQTHDIALALEAGLRFVKLNDPERLSKARKRAVEPSPIKPSSQHAKIKPLGPSDISALNKHNVFQ